MKREVRYCTTEDGVRIAYCVEGEGPPLLVVSESFGSFALERVTPFLMDFHRALGTGRQTVRIDLRGIGLSQRENLPSMAQEANIIDIEAVVRAAGLKRYAIWARGINGGLAIRYAATHVEEVCALLLFGTFATLADVFPEEARRSFAELARSSWPVAAQVFGDMSQREEFSEAGLQLAELVRKSTTGDVAAAYITSNAGADVAPFLPLVRARTLVLHRLGDGAFPFTNGQKVAAEIRNARLVPLEGVSNEPGLGDTESVLDAVNSFLDEDSETRRAINGGVAIDGGVRKEQGSLRTVLFTDLVGHSEMMSRLGDDKGRDVLREHERITREVLKAHGGTEVKTMGDGFMASFGSVTKAVECAIALQRAFAEREGEPLSVRVGLNAGEPIEEDGDLFGATVILASRIAAKADGGEILVADTVRGLCSGKGFLFADRGQFVAKGFEEPVRVFEVSWRSATGS